MFVPGEKSTYIFSWFNPLNTDTFDDPLSACSDGVWLSSLVILRPSVLVRFRDFSLLQSNALQAELIFSFN